MARKLVRGFGGTGNAIRGGLWDLAERLKSAVTTFPTGSGWVQFAVTSAVLLPLLWLLWRWGFAGFRFDLELTLVQVALIAFLFPAFVEEALFRVVLVRPPPDGATALGPVVLSALLFALWHPLQALLYDPRWESIAWNGWFVTACFLLGVASARLFFLTRSLWPSVLLHWIVVVGWKVLAGDDL